LRHRHAHVFAYRIHADSQLTKPETLEIEENIPIAELDDVAVELEPSTTPGFETRADDGIVRWHPVIAPGGSLALELAFRVETPAP
jgi:hypothetical protein